MVTKWRPGRWENPYEELIGNETNLSNRRTAFEHGADAMLKSVIEATFPLINHRDPIHVALDMSKLVHKWMDDKMRTGCEHPVSERDHVNSSLSYRLTICPECHQYILTDYTYNRKIELTPKVGAEIASGNYGLGIKLAEKYGWIPQIRG